MDAKLIRARLEDAVLDAMDRWCTSDVRWGHDDCAMACAQPLKDVLGYDPVEAFRKRYRSRNGARRVLGKGGLSRALRETAKVHGWARIAPHEAQSGDIGLARYKGVTGTVICRAPGWFVWRAEWPGYVALPAHMVKRAWKVAPHVRRELAIERVIPQVFRPLPHQIGHRRANGSIADHEVVSTTIGLTTLIEAAFAATTTAGISLATAATIGGAIIGIGASIGLSYLARLLQKSPDTSAALNDPSVRYNTRQPIPAKRIVYGTAQVGGALFFEEVKAPYLYQGWLICDDQIDSFEKIWIGTNELSFAALTPNSILVPLAVPGQPNYPTRLEVSLRLGATDQDVDPLLAREFPRLGRTVVAGSAGSTLGNMVDLGGLAAGFDDITSQASAASAALTGTGNLAGTIGKDWGSGNDKIITAIRIKAPSDNSFSDSADKAVTIVVQGSTDNFSASVVTLYTQTAAIYATAATFDQGWTGTAAYRYHRVLITESNGLGSTHQVYAAEVVFYEADANSAFRQRGIATAVFRYHFGADQTEFTALWGQVSRPNPLFLVNGVAVADPRKPSHVVDFDPADDAAVAAAKATWEWSNNAALVQAHYLMQRYGGRIDPRRMDWDKITEAADWDDGLMGTLAGELIKRHTIDGMISLDQSPQQVIAGLLAANRGFVLESAGTVWLTSSQPRDPVVTIYDGILTGALEYRAAKPKKDLINRLKTRFVSQDREFQTVDGPVLVRSDLETADQELLEGNLDLPFTLDHRRVQRLSKAFLESDRLGKRLSVNTDVMLLAKANDDPVGSAVRFESTLFPQANGIYFNESWGFGDQFASVQLALAEYDKTIETDWDATADEQDFSVASLDVS